MFESKLNRGRANGYAPLDSEGKVPLDKTYVGANGTSGISGTSGTSGLNGSQGLNGTSFSWYGNWDSTNYYQPNQVIEYEGSTYISISGDGNLNMDPSSPESEYWQLMASGGTGSSGTSGETGASGTSGTSGTSILLDSNLSFTNNTIQGNNLNAAGTIITIAQTFDARTALIGNGVNVVNNSESSQVQIGWIVRFYDGTVRTVIGSSIPGGQSYRSIQIDQNVSLDPAYPLTIESPDYLVGDDPFVELKAGTNSLILDNNGFTTFPNDIILNSSAAPSDLIGAEGDTEGMVRIDSDYIYYCTSTFVPETYQITVNPGTTYDTHVSIPKNQGIPSLYSNGWSITTSGNTTYTLTGVYSDGLNWDCEIDNLNSNYNGGTETMTLTWLEYAPVEIWKRTTLGSGTSGGSGTAGTSGESGAAGTSGESGTAGTSGTSVLLDSILTFNSNTISGSAIDPVGTKITIATAWDGSVGFQGGGLFVTDNAETSLAQSGWIIRFYDGTVRTVDFVTPSNMNQAYRSIAFDSNVDLNPAYPLTIESPDYAAGVNPYIELNIDSNNWTLNSDGTTAFPSYSFPSSDGTSGQVLATDGSGNLNWSSTSTGTSGTSGTSGATGSSGTSGTRGSSGTSGESGTSGQSGTAGTSGTSGSSGQTGASGTSGTSGNGTSGSSGATGSSGTSGTSGYVDNDWLFFIPSTSTIPSTGNNFVLSGTTTSNGSVSYNQSTGIITLAANKTYKLDASLALD
jgi:hypothetical protein